MSAELFPPAAVTQDSPRLAWLKRHNLALGELPDGTKICVGRHAIGYADTHKDAELECAEAMNVAHWSIEEFRKAGVMVPGNVEEEQC